MKQMALRKLLIILQYFVEGKKTVIWTAFPAKINIKLSVIMNFRTRRIFARFLTFLLGRVIFEGFQIFLQVKLNWNVWQVWLANGRMFFNT